MQFFPSTNKLLQFATPHIQKIYLQIGIQLKYSKIYFFTDIKFLNFAFLK